VKKSSEPWLPGFIALGIVWGSSFLFIKWGLESLTSIGVAFGRGLIGGATLLIYSAVTKTKLPNKIRDWLHLAVLALLLNAIPGYLFAFGEQRVSSVMAGLLNATTPLMTGIVISFAFKEQRINRDQSLGILLGFIGIASLTGAFSGLSRNSTTGVVALLGATLCYGVSFPYSKRYIGKMSYSSTALATTQVCSSAVLLSPFALIIGVRHAPLNSHAIWGMLLLGAMGTGVAYIWNFRNVRIAGSAVASTVTYITPVVATILGVWFLGEPFGAHQILGGVLVLLSAALVQKRIHIFNKG
jgi:drug/metabolite transporter (DMT)-like permease